MKNQQEILTPEQARHVRRTLLGMTQAEVAKGAGVSRSMLGGFEVGSMALSDPVKRKVRDYFENALEAQGIDPADVFDGQDDDDNQEDTARPTGVAFKRPAIANGTGRRPKFIKGTECVYISGTVADEAERERLHERLEAIRDRLTDMGEQKARAGIFAPFDDDTDKLIDEGRALVTETGLLYLRLFGHDLAPAPTPAMVQRKQRPETVADALGLVFVDVFKALRIRRNGKRDEQGADDDQDEPDETPKPKNAGRNALAA